MLLLLLPLPFCCRRHTLQYHHTMHATRLAYYSRATIPCCCQPLARARYDFQTKRRASTTRRPAPLVIIDGLLLVPPSRAVCACVCV